MRCNTNASLAFMNLIVLALSFWQMYFVYYRCYNIPIIQKCGKKSKNTTDHRQNILLAVFVASTYNLFHYQIVNVKYRSKLYAIIEIMRTNILILVIYYYLRMASEEILKRHSYICFKRVLATFCIVINILMITCATIIFADMS